MNYKSDEHKYDKIINLPHHQSKKRKHMSMTERAAQFGAFRALTGYEDEIAETARHTDKKIELDEYTKTEINAKLRYINDHIDNRPEVSITYFVTDERKSGGTYITVSGVVSKIRVFERLLVFDDGAEIPMDEILSIEGNLFDKTESVPFPKSRQ